MTDSHIRMTVVHVDGFVMRIDNIIPGLDIIMLNTLCEYTKHLDEINEAQTDMLLYGQGMLLFSGNPLTIKRIPPWELYTS